MLIYLPWAGPIIICGRKHKQDAVLIVSGLSMLLHDDGCLMGANFSKPLVASKVTHLVCFKFEGEKYELAKKTKKIKLVNHRWLEDCLKAWEILPETDYDKWLILLSLLGGGRG